MRNRLAQIATLGAYGYQAAAALGLVLAVAHVLSGAEYARFSLTMASAQFAAIGIFEWVRIAATRFYPGPDPKRAPLQKASLGAGFVASAGVGVLISFGAILGGASASVVLLGAAVAVAQGLTDLYLTFVRFRGDLGTFARLQSLRATAMVGFAVSGALLTGASIGALAGIVLAHASIVLVAAITDPKLRTTPWRHPATDLLRAQLAYGAPTAAASALHLGTVLLARFVIAATMPPTSAGSALFAIDIIQRPISLATTVIHAIMYPRLVSLFDKGGISIAKAHLHRMYTVETCAVLLTGTVFALAFFSRQLIDIVTPYAYRDEISAHAAWAALAFSLRAILINVSTLTMHLKKNVRLILTISIIDLVILSIIILLNNIMGSTFSPLAILAASSAITLSTSLAAGRITKRI